MIWVKALVGVTTSDQRLRKGITAQIKEGDAKSLILANRVRQATEQEIKQALCSQRDEINKQLGEQPQQKTKKKRGKR